MLVHYVDGSEEEDEWIPMDKLKFRACTDDEEEEEGEEEMEQVCNTISGARWNRSAIPYPAQSSCSNFYQLLPFASKIFLLSRFSCIHAHPNFPGEQQQEECKSAPQAKRGRDGVSKTAGTVTAEVLMGLLARGLSQADATIELGLKNKFELQRLCAQRGIPKRNTKYTRNEIEHAVVQASRQAGAPIPISVNLRGHIQRDKGPWSPTAVETASFP